MRDLEQQLAELRARAARAAASCDQRFEEKLRFEAQQGLEEQHDSRWPAVLQRELRQLPGEEVETARGRHLEKETLYAAHRHHGSADIGALSDLPRDLFAALSGGSICDSGPEEWAFLDTETTGLAGGTGTCAFLVGVGRITREGFRIRQFFMRDHGEEASQLDALARHLAPCRVLITYNGRSFDQPLLETRYRLHRTRPPFARMEHLDLLYGARRLWKLRFESCRLVDLENRVLGVEREGDIPGALIPYVYFEFLRTGQTVRLAPVFEHNAIDILSLACLTGIVPHAFRDPSHVALRHGSELAGLARWLEAAGDWEGSRSLLRRAIHAGLPDHLLFRAMWDLAQLERKLAGAGSLEAGTGPARPPNRERNPPGLAAQPETGDSPESSVVPASSLETSVDAALALWEDLAASPNAFRVRAIEELAKHHEHRLKDRVAALEWTRKARALEDSADLARREARLTRPASKRSGVRRGRRLSTAPVRALL